MSIFNIFARKDINEVVELFCILRLPRHKIYAPQIPKSTTKVKKSTTARAVLFFNEMC